MNDDLQDETLLSDQADINLGLEGFESLDGMILGENGEDHDAEKLQKFDEMMLNKMVEDGDQSQQNSLG